MTSLKKTCSSLSLALLAAAPVHAQTVQSALVSEGEPGPLGWFLLVLAIGGLALWRRRF